MKREKIVPELRGDVEAPNVHITPEAYLRIRTLVKQCDEEVGWMGSVERSGDDYCIYSIHMFDQEVHAAETDIDAESIGKVSFQLIEDGRIQEVNEMHFWGHSHVNMAVSPSGQDVQQAHDFGENGIDFMICGIFNKKGEITIDFYDFEHQEVWRELSLILGTPEELARINLETKNLIKEHVTYAKPITKHGNIRSNNPLYGAWDLEDENKWYNGYYSGHGGNRVAPSVSANQAGGTEVKPVGQGHSGGTQRSQPVVQAGSSGIKQGTGVSSQPTGDKPVSTNTSSAGVLDPEKPKVNGNSNHAGGQHGGQEGAVGSTP